MNLPVPHSSFGPPEPINPDLRASLSALHSRVAWRGSIPVLLDCSVGPKTRAALEARAADIQESLAQRDRAALETALDEMFAVMKLSGSDKADPEALTELYAARLSSLPVWAVFAAIDEITRGQAESTIFAPSAPDIYERASSLVAPFRVERGRIAEVLSAAAGRIVRPGSNERVAKGFEKLSAALADTAAAEKLSYPETRKGQS